MIVTALRFIAATILYFSTFGVVFVFEGIGCGGDGNEWMKKAVALTEKVKARLEMISRPRRRHWQAWMAMCGALAIHVADEALTGWLNWYNPTVRGIHEQYQLVLLPIFLPVFTFEIWLSLLIFAVVSLSAASYFVWTGRWAMRPISHVFAVFMLVNALVHIAHSIYMDFICVICG